MKERVLNILRKEDPLLFEKVRLRMPRMRISTIHSFCLKLLKRFCLDLDIDPRSVSWTVSMPASFGQRPYTSRCSKRAGTGSSSTN